MPEATEAQRRTRLGTWGFGADKADTKCANLSGGEKARLLLALTAFHAPHLLILDEPTNHLDVDSREALIHAIAEYEGAVILISHDRHLVEATADRLWLVADGTVRTYDGDMESYRTELLQARSPKTERRNTGEPNSDTRASRADQRKAAADRRAELAPLKKAMQTAEKAVEKLAAELARLDAQLAAPDLYADAAKASRISQERGQTAKRLGEAEEAWLTATSAYEDAEQEATA
jgi:ATP-binding cassette, subfamily F, member 3